MRVLLISPAIEEAHRGDPNADSHYPIGLGYIHAAAEQAGHEVKTIFMNNNTYDECLAAYDKVLAEFKPGVVGVQMMSHNRVCGYRIIERTPKDTKVVVGGIHATVMHDQIVRKYPRVTVVVGEGEETFVELLDWFDGSSTGGVEDISDIAGIAYDEYGGVTMTGRRELSDIDSLPMMKHDVFIHDGKYMAGILTSRGCPFSCSFCVLDSFSRRKVRYRSVNAVVDEIEYIITNFPSIGQIWFHDDSFFLDNARAIAICDEIVRRGIKMDFVCSARMKPISRELVEALERAGFSQVLFGLESGSDEVLQYANKKISKDDARRAFAMFRNSNIRITAFLIVGLYGEHDGSIQETIEFVKELQRINYTYYDDFGVCMVYPGTEIYTAMVDNGEMTDEYWLTDKPVPYFTGGGYTTEELFEIKKEMQKHISMKYMTTPEGFINQHEQLEAMIEYAYRFNFSFLKAFAADVLRFHDTLGCSLVRGYREAALRDIKEKLCTLIARKNMLTDEQERDMRAEVFSGETKRFFGEHCACGDFFERRFEL